jgi:hypothetical protein
VSTGQLRDLMETAVGEPPHRVSVTAVRRQAARRRMLEYVAAAVAVALLAGAGFAVAARIAGPGPASTPRIPAGAPRFYVQQAFSTAPPATTVVRSRATGAVTARVRCPWGAAQPATGQIVPVSHQMFFMICQTVTRRGESPVVTGSRIYRFQLTGSGQIRGYSLVPGGALPRLSAGNLAAAADGTELAVATLPAGTAANSPVPASIMVISTRTGARAVWRGTPAVPGKMSFTAGDLSLTADGHELVYVAVPRCIRGRCKPTGNGEEVRALSPATQGGQLSSSRLLARQSALVPLSSGYLDGAIVSPSGSSVKVLVMNSPGRGATTVSVVKVSAATGVPLRVLYRVTTGDGFSFRFFSSDPSGRYLILNVGPTSGMTNGWIDHGRLVTLNPVAGNNVFYETW